MPIMALVLRSYPGFCNSSFANDILQAGDLYIDFPSAGLDFVRYIFQCFVPTVSYLLHAAQKAKKLEAGSSHDKLPQRIPETQLPKL
jgi:hypothetical protein